MTDALEIASTWLEGMRHTHVTRAVTYKRGAASVVLSATLGRTVFEQADEYGVILKIESRDYLIRTEDLVLSGGSTLPAAGDRIEDTQGSTTYVYEVVAPGAVPAYRFSDPWKQTLRVHTKYIGTAV